MNVRRNTYKTDTPRIKSIILYSGLAVTSIAAVILAVQVFLLKRQEEISAELPSQTVAAAAAAIRPPPPAIAKTVSSPESFDNRWDGPILYYHQAGDLAPLNFILIEKDLQKLSLYQYNGDYALIKTYRCVTGKQKGDKERENDDKTPEGIYFNTKTYRDRKITIFGDRAFGLSYPDVFDDLDGRGGSGIFIHGSNRDINPYSTNGCLVLDNLDLADLDERVRFEETPVIIGKRLPYRFAAAKRDLKAIVPVVKKAMIPKDHLNKKVSFSRLTIMGYQDQLVALGKMQVNRPATLAGTSRAYLADAGKNLLVLLKSEWREEKILTAKAPAQPVENRQIAEIVESWRVAWEKERLNEYISFYHPAFSNKGRSLTEWRQYKGRLNKRYHRISVKVSELLVKANGSKAFAYFKQQYLTESYKADGFKRLEFRKTGNRWKIYREASFPTKPSSWPS